MSEALPQISIERKIYVIRGESVMLDRQIQVAFAAIKSLMPPPPAPAIERSTKKLGFGPRPKSRSAHRPPAKE